MKALFFVFLRIFNTLISMYPLLNFVFLFLVFRIFNKTIMKFLNNHKDILIKLSLFSVFLCLFIILLQTFIPSITIDIQSFLWVKGRALYHSINEPFFYSIFYGPIYYIFFGIPLFFTKNLFIASLLSRIAAFLLLCLDFVLMYKIVGQIIKDKVPKSQLRDYKRLGVLLLFLFYFSLLVGALSGGLEKDILILTVVLLSMYISQRTTKSYNLLLQPLLFGIIVNIKITAGVFLIPSLWLMYVKPFSRRFLFKDGVVFGVLFVLFSIFPFLDPKISLINFLALILPTGNVPNSLSSLAHSLNYIGIMAFFLLCSFPISAMIKEKDYSVFPWLITTILILPVALKAGAGGHHLMPIIPFFIATYISLLSKREQTAPFKYWRILLAALMLSLSFNVVRTIIPYAQTIHYVNFQKQLINEMEGVISQFPNKSIVYNSVNYIGHFEDNSVLSLFLLSKGNPLFLDYQNLCGYMIPARKLPPRLLENIQKREYDVMVFDKGAIPFKYQESLLGDLTSINSKEGYYKQFQISFYNHHKIWLKTDSIPFKLLVIQKWMTLDTESFLFPRIDMFPHQFNDTFKQNYRFYKRTTRFDVYIKNRPN